MVRTEVFFSSDASVGLLVEIRALLIDAFDGDFSDNDWGHALGGLHVVVIDDRHVIAHASVVARPIEVGAVIYRAGYVEGVATAPERRHTGLGSMAMREIGAVIRRDYELGALSTGSHQFYERLGWERWRGRTFVRDNATDELQPTPDDDDAVMVLRCKRSASIDLTSPIICESRPGDPW